MGNIKPDSIITGNINPITEKSNAAICVSTTEEISNPKARETKINITETKINNSKLPLWARLAQKPQDRAL